MCVRCHVCATHCVCNVCVTIQLPLCVVVWSPSICCLIIFSCIYRKEFNIEVLKHFIKLHEFRGKLIVDALRYDVQYICALYIHYT